MSVSEILQDADHRMKAAVDSMVHDFSTYRTGRANPSVLERVHIDYFGTETPITQIASVSVPEPRQLLIVPYDKKMTPQIEKAIMKSDLGINPNNDGTGIRLNFPQMNEDRRKEMVKIVNHRVEQTRVAIRNVRRDAIERLKALEKKKEITQDDVKANEAKLQKTTDGFIHQAEELGKKKDAELMQV